MAFAPARIFPSLIRHRRLAKIAHTVLLRARLLPKGKLNSRSQVVKYGFQRGAGTAARLRPSLFNVSLSLSLTLRLSIARKGIPLTCSINSLTFPHLGSRWCVARRHWAVRPHKAWLAIFVHTRDRHQWSRSSAATVCDSNLSARKIKLSASD